MKLFDKTGRSLITGPGWIAKPVKYFLDVYETVYGPIYARRHYKNSIINGRSVIQGLAQIKQRWPDVQSQEKQSPIFILSAGWRSGSTLMQRLIMSRSSILVWGEPYSHARIISHLAAGVSAITESWPEDEWFIDRYDLNKLDSTFVANMYPSITDMQYACLAYFKTMLDLPAKEKGFARWGLKDVRLTIDDAYFIKWLFPNAKFIFLCRNPFDAYRSYRADRSWYFEWPESPVFTATEFGRNWATLVKGFYEGVSDIGGIFVRYEDILSGVANINMIETYLDIQIDTTLLSNKVGSHYKSRDSIPSYELIRLKNEVESMATALQYEYIS